MFMLWRTSNWILILVLCWEHGSTTCSVIKVMWTPVYDLYRLLLVLFYSLWLLCACKGLLLCCIGFIKYNGNKQLVGPTECCRVLGDPSRWFGVNPPSWADVSPQLSSLLVLLAAHLDVLPAPWIPAGLYGVLPPDVGPVFSPSRWLFLDSLVAWRTVSSVLWRHVLQHLTTHNSGVSIHPLHQCVEGGYDYTHNSGVSIHLFISVWREGMTTHTTVESPFTSSSVWREGMTTHTTVESPFTSSSVCGGRVWLHTQQWSLHSPLHQCVEGGYDYTHNSGVSIHLFISVWREGMTTHTTVESPFTSSSVCGGRVWLHTQQWSLHSPLHQCVEGGYHCSLHGLMSRIIVNYGICLIMINKVPL